MHHLVFFNKYHGNVFVPVWFRKDGRSSQSSSYRFGFNRKEKYSWAANGNIYDYGFRIYNPQYAKFLSVDPLTKSYPFYTPYQFAGNKPIAAIDLDGLEEVIKIYSNTDDGHVKLEVYDYKTATMSTELVGVEHSKRTHKYSQDEFINRKNSYYDAFAVAPNLFQSGYKEYAGGMVGQDNGFKGYFRGTLTISSGKNGNVLSYDSRPVKRSSINWGIYAKAFKTFNPIYPVPDPMIEGSGKFSSTVKNVHSAAGIVLAGPAALGASSSSLIGLGARASVLNGMDDFSSSFTSDNSTFIQNIPGEDVGNSIKMGLNIAGVAGSTNSLMKNVFETENYIRAGSDAISITLDIESFFGTKNNNSNGVRE